MCDLDKEPSKPRSNKRMILFYRLNWSWVIVLGDLEHSESHWNFGYYKCIKFEEVKGVIRKMRGGRAIEPAKIPFEIMKERNQSKYEVANYVV